jgi:hypothetical protein
VADFLRWYVRLSALLTVVHLTVDLLKRSKSSSVNQNGFGGDQAGEAEVKRLVDEYLDLYVDFVILEERVQGNLPAVEGIRIVKERLPAGE